MPMSQGPQLDLLQILPLFAPNSAGSDRLMTSLTLIGAKQTFPFLCEMLEKSGRSLIVPELCESFCGDVASRTAATALKVLFDHHGSDKSQTHDYHLVYGVLLKTPANITAILEVGIGTNHLDVPSSMGSSGKPGASLRAFGEFLPAARIFGADIDTRILFQENNIKTFYVNQVDRSSFALLETEIGQDLDLIIDDGLHAPSANLSVLIYAMGRLKIDGWFVVEDIRAEALPLWQVVTALMPANYRVHLLAGKVSLVFAAQRMS